MKGHFKDVTEDPGWHSGEIWLLIPWSYLPGSLVLGSLFNPVISALPPAFGGSRRIPSVPLDFAFLFFSQLSPCQAPYAVGEETFFYLPEAPGIPPEWVFLLPLPCLIILSLLPAIGERISSYSLRYSSWDYLHSTWYPACDLVWVLQHLTQWKCSFSGGLRLD